MTVDNLVITWRQFVTVLSGIRVSFVITSLTKAFNAFGNLPGNAFFSFYRLCICSQLGPTRCQDGCINQIFFLYVVAISFPVKYDEVSDVVEK